MKLLEILKVKYKTLSNTKPGGLSPQTNAITSKNIKNKSPPYKKMTYKKWVCTDCNHELFYTVRSCLLCESANIDEITMSRRGERTWAQTKSVTVLK